MISLSSKNSSNHTVPTPILGFGVGFLLVPIGNTDEVKTETQGQLLPDVVVGEGSKVNSF